jgi:hypothetical protein
MGARTLASASAEPHGPWRVNEVLFISFYMYETLF